MDLSFTRFDRIAEVTVLPADLAVLMVGVAARQAASRTATIEAAFTRVLVDPRLFAPLDGAFNGAMASALMRWKEQ